MKKLFSKVLAVVCAVLLTVLSACQPAVQPQSGTNAGDGTKAGTGAVSTTKAKPEEKVVFEIFKNFSAPEYPPDGGKAKPIILEALAKAGLGNVDFEVTLASGSEYTTKLNALAAAGDLPDFFTLDAASLVRFQEQGLLYNVKDLLYNSPNLMKVMNEDSLVTLSEGDALYCIPMGYMPESFNGSSTSALIARKDWLEKLNLPEPTTLEEYYQVLKAFTENDPDGNQKNDTYGLGATKSTVFPSIFGAFGIIPGFWFERDGVLKQGSVLPEAKEAIAVLRKWYSEGLIDPDFPVTESKAAEEKFVNSKVGIYFATAMSISPDTEVHAALLKLVPDAKLTMLVPPKGPNGHSGWSENVEHYKRPSGISAACKHPELLMRFLDWSVDTSENGGFYLLTYGIEGEHYIYHRDKNAIELTGVSYSDLYALGFSNPVRFLQLVDRRWMNEEAKEAMAIANTHIIKSKFNKQLSIMNDYPDLNTLFSEYFVKIVTGALPLDAYDEYVKKYYESGGKQVEEAVNAEYKKMNQ